MHYEPYMICITSPIAFFSWVKNKISSARMTEVLDDVEKIVQFWEKFPKPKRLNSKSCKMSKLHWIIFWLLQSYTSSAILLVLWSHFWSIFTLINRWFRSYSLSQNHHYLSSWDHCAAWSQWILQICWTTEGNWPHWQNKIVTCWHN